MMDKWSLVEEVPRDECEVCAIPSLPRVLPFVSINGWSLARWKIVIYYKHAWHGWKHLLQQAQVEITLTSSSPQA
jgi:hypothetical protein